MKTKNKITTYHKGIYAEIYAAVYLWLKGYRIRAWRYKTKMGEVDILAEKNKSLIAVEVKAHATHESAMTSISPTSRLRIYHAAQDYARRHHLADYPLRCDAILVMGVRVRHITHAWDEGGHL